jgi:DNA-binding MarR family transcriptional regulator
MANSFDIAELMGCSCLRLRRAAREATRLYDRHLEPTGLGGNQVTMLTVLVAAEHRGARGLRQRELAAFIGADPSTMSRNLKPLARRGLVSMRPDPTDRRVRILAITAKGRAKLEQAWPYWRAAQAKMKDALGEPSLRSLHRLLDRSAAALSG